jgi:uncharacterized lipoprotein
MSSSWGRPAALAALMVVLAATAGCGVFHGGSRKCREPAMRADVENRPALRLPSGLDAPDRRGAVRIPELDEPEAPRSPRDPCLSFPPEYKAAPVSQR